jgi:hypothetical protein
MALAGMCCALGGWALTMLIPALIETLKGHFSLAVLVGGLALTVLLGVLILVVVLALADMFGG